MLTILQIGNESLAFNVMIVSVFSSKRESSITRVSTKCRGRPLVLGDFDQGVQKYIKALRVAAGEGIKHIYHGHYKTQN